MTDSMVKRVARALWVNDYSHDDGTSYIDPEDWRWLPGPTKDEYCSTARAAMEAMKVRPTEDMLLAYFSAIESRPSDPYGAHMAMIEVALSAKKKAPAP